MEKELTLEEVFTKPLENVKMVVVFIHAPSKAVGPIYGYDYHLSFSEIRAMVDKVIDKVYP